MSKPRPTLVAHADWSVSPKKRWMAVAHQQPDGSYSCEAPNLVGAPGDLLNRLRAEANRQDAILLGFDFPIGLPLRYAQATGIGNFLDALPDFGRGDWADFYRVAAEPREISLRRPFYPARPGGTRRQHLLDALGMDSMDDLRRRCELGHAKRRPAAPLFWTMGGQQVGKAAITGWREVLGLALCESPEPAAIWPFSGRLDDLLDSRQVVLAETYPGEFYHHLGVRFPFPENAQPPTKLVSKTGSKSGKRSQASRAANASSLIDWARDAGVLLSPEFRQAVLAGFGDGPNGEDRFDAAVGLLGMLNVLLGFRLPGEPPEGELRRVEGWILGQAF